jgi:hypothetical protein
MTTPWPVRRYLIIGAATLAVLVGGFGTWSVLAQINGAVITSGQIEVDRKEGRVGIEKTHQRVDEAVSKVDRIGGKLDSVSENVSKLLTLALEQSKK